MPGKLWPTLFGEKKVIHYIWRSARLEPKPVITAGTVLFVIVLLMAAIVSVFTLQNTHSQLPAPPAAAAEGVVRIIKIPVQDQLPSSESVHVLPQEHQSAPMEKTIIDSEHKIEALGEFVSQNRPENNVLPNAETQMGKKEKIENLLTKDPLAQFGWQYSKIHQDWRFYPGIDLLTGNAQIAAIVGGEVEEVTSKEDIGLTVTVISGQYKIYYASLQGVFLQKGDIIATGDTIGIGTRENGKDTYRLHLRVQSIPAGKYINPSEVLPI